MGVYIPWERLVEDAARNESFSRDVYAHNHKQGAGYPAYTTVIQLTLGAPSNR